MDDTTKGVPRAQVNIFQKAEPVIDITGLRFTWNQERSALLNIDHFQVGKSELLLVMGASGSGKSTLLSLITGILTPQMGNVRVLGQNLAELKATERDRFRADSMGYIFQMFNLIPYLNVLENVVLPCRFSSLRKSNALHQASSLDEAALHLLNHLNLRSKDLLSKPVVELSVGQQQRVAAARALIGRPKLVIADEPTSSLDADHREAFLQLLFEECRDSGATLLFVSHDRSLAPLFDRVVDFREINLSFGAQKESDT